MSSRMTSTSDRLIAPAPDGGELGDSLSASFSCDSQSTSQKRRLQRRRRETRFATVVSTASLLISLATVVLVMWFTGDIGPKVNLLWKHHPPNVSSFSPSLPAAAAVGEIKSPESQTRVDQASDGGDSMSHEAPSTTVTSQTTVGNTSPTQPLPLPAKPRGFECWSDAIDGSKGVYPNSVNVTKWRTSERLSSQCPIMSSNPVELFIEEEGDYFLYSQAWMSGGMNKGVVLQKVRNETGGERSLRIRHTIVCWHTCDGSRDRTGSVRLREADITALDVLNSYVAVQLHLRQGATLGVMVTSPNVTGGHDAAWTKIVLGLVRLS